MSISPGTQFEGLPRDSLASHRTTEGAKIVGIGPQEWGKAVEQRAQQSQSLLSQTALLVLAKGGAI